MFLLCLILILTDLCFAKVTEKQYASMPELFHQDNYDKCMLLGDEALYCSITYDLEPLNEQNASEIWEIIKEVSSDDFNYRHDHLRHGICVPFTCPSNEKRNWQRLKTVKSTPVEMLSIFQGVRFYNMVLIMLAHTALSFVMLPIMNTKYTERSTPLLTEKSGHLYIHLFTFLSSGPLGVSTIFFMSAFFLTYAIFSCAESKKRISLKLLLKTLIARYIRLTPALAVTVLFHRTWLRHLGSGPNWYNVIGKEYLRCKENWWTNLLYLNNYINKRRMCMAITWYLALDTQYYAMLLFVIWFMIKYPKLIWPTVGCLLSLNILATFIHNYRGNYEMLLIPKPEIAYNMNAKNIENNPDFYEQTTDGIGGTAGPIMGLAYGYIFYKYKNQKLFTSNLMFHQVLYFFLTYGLGLTISLLPGVWFMMNKAPHDALWASVYVAMSRPIFCFALGYLLFGVTQGLGWLTKNVLKWPPVYILGRLTYSAYLIHMSLILFTSAVARSPVYIHDFLIYRDLIENISLSYLAALLITLCVEMPISELQKLTLPAKLEVKLAVKKRK